MAASIKKEITELTELRNDLIREIEDIYTVLDTINETVKAQGDYLAMVGRVVTDLNHENLMEKLAQTTGQQKPVEKFHTDYLETVKFNDGVLPN